MPLCLPFEGKKLPEDPGADTVDFPKRTTPAKGMLPGVCTGPECVELLLPSSLERSSVDFPLK